VPLRVGRFVDAFDVQRRVPDCVLLSHAALPCNDVRSVPVRPVVLRSGGLVGTVTELRFAQQFAQRFDIAAESPSRKPRLDLLQQPVVAVRVAE